jgi:DNA invertase Pin-like site-specific DNA recombinase
MLNTEQNAKNKLTVLYARLSKEDEQLGTSGSIANQLKLLEDYAVANGFTPTIRLSDDGYTGTNFNRPGWQELMSRVESGEVGTILLKTMDRMGRDYLRVGLYREMFREKGVRLIAVGEGYDSDKGEDDLNPFREIMAEWYARDTSRKVKTILHAKGKSGKHMTNAAVYGYIKSPEDKNLWLIDPEAASVVRRIFAMTIDGKGAYQIARTFTDEQILRPSAYIELRDGREITEPNDRFNWGGRTITNILDRPEYMGCTVNFRTKKDSYKSKKHYHVPKEEWVVFEDTQEAIVTRETWKTAQKCHTVKRRKGSTGEVNPLTGLVYCADCGGRMYNHRSGDGTCESHNCYACVRYSQYPPKCTMHYIKVSVLQEIVLDTIRKVCGFVRESEEEFVKMVREASQIQTAETAKEQKKQIAKAQKRVNDLDGIISSLYEDKVSGSITAKRFEMLSTQYEAEQETLQTQIQSLQADLDRFADESGKAEQFITLVRRYTEFDELTGTMLNEFVSRINVHEASKINGRRSQRVEVVLNFIGEFALPNDNTDEPEPFDPIEHQRAIYRKSYYKHRDEILAKTRAKREAIKAAKLASMPKKSPEEIAAEQAARKARKREYQRNYQREWQRKKRDEKMAAIGVA